MKLRQSIQSLTKFERLLWLGSAAVVAGSFLLAPEKDWLSLCASLIGVSALIFLARGLVLGQVLTVVFSVFYGVISWFFRYYGEMITYLGMTAPMAALAIVSWLRHPYGDTPEVQVHRLTGGEIAVMAGLTAAVTAAFYFILRALGTANLAVSTLSVTTSFLASYLTFMRSPWYALAYAANDIVLIVLWVLATIAVPAYLPMVFCFVAFFFNDLYGFYSWRGMQRRQNQ